MIKVKKRTRSVGVEVWNSNASSLSARTGDLVHKQLNPRRHGYKLSKLSGIQIHPLTRTLMWLSRSSPHPDSPSKAASNHGK
ncbi:hypothetical protein NL676_028057 [Syzygium grande]|nr:hypothetical protein NL676_028057 [Syzygium grande]